MKAMPKNTAFTALFCPVYSIAKGNISCKVRKAITPPTGSNKNALTAMPEHRVLSRAKRKKVNLIREGPQEFQDSSCWEIGKLQINKSKLHM